MRGLERREFNQVERKAIGLLSKHMPIRDAEGVLLTARRLAGVSSAPQKLRPAQEFVHGPLRSAVIAAVSADVGRWLTATMDQVVAELAANRYSGLHPSMRRAPRRRVVIGAESADLVELLACHLRGQAELSWAITGFEVIGEVRDHSVHKAVLVLRPPFPGLLAVARRAHRAGCRVVLWGGPRSAALPGKVDVLPSEAPALLVATLCLR